MAKYQRVAKDFLFKITFTAEDKLKGKQLKHAIYYYHYLLPGTTKQIKSKEAENAPTENNVTIELDDQSERFPVGMPVYKEFNKVEHKGNIISYDSQHRLYELDYEDINKE